LRSPLYPALFVRARDLRVREWHISAAQAYMADHHDAGGAGRAMASSGAAFGSDFVLGP